MKYSFVLMHYFFFLLLPRFDHLVFPSCKYSNTLMPFMSLNWIEFFYVFSFFSSSSSFSLVYVGNIKIGKCCAIVTVKNILENTNFCFIHFIYSRDYQKKHSQMTDDKVNFETVRHQAEMFLPDDLKVPILNSIDICSKKVVPSPDKCDTALK